MKIKPYSVKFVGDDKVYLLTPMEYAIQQRCLSILPEDMPVVKKYFIRSFYTNDEFTNDTVTLLLEAILKDLIFKHYHYYSNKPFKLDRLRRKIYSIYNDIYNEFGRRKRKYTATIGLPDILDLLLDKDNLDNILRVKREESQEAIQYAYDSFKEIVRKPQYKHNTMAISYISGTISSRQTNQCLVVRGKVADLGSEVFKKPVFHNYAIGMNTMYSIAVDSRSGTIALFYSTTSIQDAETLSNKLRKVSSIVSHLANDDCGATDGIEMTIVGPGKDEYGGWYDGDLKNLVGTSYKLNINDNWEVIKGNEDFLIGKKVILRTALSCKHPDRTTICKHCIGYQSFNIQQFNNPGMAMIVPFTDGHNQRSLSTKHYTESAKILNIRLSPEASEYFQIKEDIVKIKKDKQKKSKLVIPLSEFFGISELAIAKDIDRLTPSRVAMIRNMYIITADEALIDVSLGKDVKKAIPTIEFLKYIAKGHYTIKDKDVIIDIDKWKHSQSMLTIPPITFDNDLYSKTVEKFITNPNAALNTKLISPSMFLENLFRLVNRKASVSIATLSVLAYVLTVRDEKGKDYRLARGVETGTVVGIDKINDNRSLSTVFSALTVNKLNSLGTMASSKKEPHPMDVIFDPVTAVRLYKEQKGK